MPSTSKKQQRLMGMAYAYKKGKLRNASEKIKEVARDMTRKQLKDFAKTKTKDLPEKKAALLEDIYFSGFIKRAAEYGFNENEVLHIIKMASGVTDKTSQENIAFRNTAAPELNPAPQPAARISGGQIGLQSAAGKPSPQPQPQQPQSEPQQNIAFRNTAAPQLNPAQQPQQPQSQPQQPQPSYTEQDKINVVGKYKNLGVAGSPENQKFVQAVKAEQAAGRPVNLMQMADKMFGTGNSRPDPYRGRGNPYAQDVRENRELAQMDQNRSTQAYINHMNRGTENLRGLTGVVQNAQTNLANPSISPQERAFYQNVLNQRGPELKSMLASMRAGR